MASLVSRYADAIVAAADAIADEARAFEPRGQVVTIANGSDFDDFAGMEHHPSPRFRITHTGSFFGRRDPRPFITRARRLGPRPRRALRRRLPRRPTASGREGLGLGDRLELIPYVPRRQSLELQRDSEALLLLIPEADGRGHGVLSGKVFEYLAAERPILAAVPPGRGRRRADPRDGPGRGRAARRRPRRSERRSRVSTPAGRRASSTARRSMPRPGERLSP